MASRHEWQSAKNPPRASEAGEGQGSSPGPSERSERGLSRNVPLLGLVSFFNDFGAEMALPLLPFFLVALQAPPGGVAAMEGLAWAAVYFSTLPSGLLSDRWGRRRPIVILGYGVAAVARGGFVVASHWLHVLASRLVDRAGKGLRSPPRDALVAESTARGRWGRAFGLQRALDSAGAVAGSSTAILLLAAGLDHRAIFLAALVPSAVSVTLLLPVREPPARSRPTAEAESTRSPLNPELKRFLGVAFLYALGNLSAVVLLLRASELGVSPAAGAALYIGFNVAGALMAYPAGLLSDRLGRGRALLLCLLLQAAAMAGFALLAPGLLGLAALFALAGLSYEFFQTASRAYVSDLAQRESRATAIAGYQTTLGAGTLAGGAAVGALWSLHGAPAAFGFAAAAALLSALLLVLRRETFFRSRA